MKKGTKKKFNYKKFLVFIILLITITISIKLISDIKTKNIIILNNSYYTDDDIIYTSNIQNYPKFLFLSKKNIKNKLLKLDLIEDVTINKEWNFILKIDIKEKKVLYLDKTENKYVLSDNSSLDNNTNYIVPILINYVPDDIRIELNESLSKLNINIIEMISEIEYDKNDYDDKRFLFYMSDGNEVYINTLKMDNLNQYISIISTLNNKKGILYLDSGNYFEIKEK